MLKPTLFLSIMIGWIILLLALPCMGYGVWMKKKDIFGFVLFLISIGAVVPYLWGAVYIAADQVENIWNYRSFLK